jgi:hypothetical protein
MLVMPANDPAADPIATPPAPVEAKPVEASAGEDLKEKFRAALEHKRTGGPGADGAHGGGKTGNATSNGKVQRTFRRRAGGG